MRLREAGNPDDTELVNSVIPLARPLRTARDLAPLLDKFAERRVVMLGEASHGTKEFYTWRAEISRYLIDHHGFRFIAVEGDWPPCWEVNRAVHDPAPHPTRDILRAFHRWPTWMWGNEEIAEFTTWLQARNGAKARGEKCGFYGLDVYSLFESMSAAIATVKKFNPFLARSLQNRYGCFGRFLGDERAYAKSLLNFPAGCQEEVVAALRELLHQRLQSPGARDQPWADPLFDAEQNARIAANAENYYRTMVHGNEDSWNVRDRHMLDTLDQLLERYGAGAKAIVWAHNTHIGDYRATDMLAEGQINLGGIAREKWGDENVALVGFGTNEGTVIASRAWDGPIEKMNVPPGKPGSVESAFHKVSAAKAAGAFFLDLEQKEARESPLLEARGHRAIGVVYHPAHEQIGNYVPSVLPYRYDAFIFLDRTNSLLPLGLGFDRAEFPDTWPQGM